MPPDKKYGTAIWGLVFAALLQFGTAMWWASGVTNRGEELDKRIGKVEENQQQTIKMATAVAVLQIQVVTLNKNLERLNSNYERSGMQSRER